MPPSPSIGSHEAHLEIWQKALEAERGLKITLATHDEAVALRFRLYHARTAQQRFHKKVYSTDHALHGKSYYDDLTVKVKDNVLTIEKAAELNIQAMEEL